jgi:quinol monooxygenase YgiN
MSYVRVSLMQPRSGRAAEVREHLDELADFFAKQAGFIEGYTLYSSDALVGRVTVWESEASADHAATSTHVLAVRSRLDAVIEPGSHQEHAFDGTRFAPSVAAS